MNSNSFTRSDRISMRENRQSLSGSSLLPWCGYADDLVLFLQSKTSLQNATILLDCIFTKYGLTINVQKTESMILNHVDPVYPTTLISLRNVELSNVCEFKYLGAYLHYNERKKLIIVSSLLLLNSRKCQMLFKTSKLTSKLVFCF